MTPASFFSSLFTAIKSGLITTIVPDLLTFLQNTKGLNLLSLTDRLQYVAQLDLLRSTVMTQLPNLEVADLQQLNALFSNELQSVLNGALASNTTTSAGAFLAGNAAQQQLNPAAINKA
jgi:hypothetical protein